MKNGKGEEHQVVELLFLSQGHQFTKQETSDLVAITSVLHWRKTVRLWDIEGKQPTATPPDLSTAYITFADGKKFKVRFFASLSTCLF